MVVTCSFETHEVTRYGDRLAHNLEVAGLIAAGVRRMLSLSVAIGGIHADGVTFARRSGGLTASAVTGSCCGGGGAGGTGCPVLGAGSVNVHREDSGHGFDAENHSSSAWGGGLLGYGVITMKQAVNLGDPDSLLTGPNKSGFSDGGDDDLHSPSNGTSHWAAVSTSSTFGRGKFHMWDENCPRYSAGPPVRSVLLGFRTLPTDPRRSHVGK